LGREPVQQLLGAPHHAEFLPSDALLHYRVGRDGVRQPGERVYLTLQRVDVSAEGRAPAPLTHEIKRPVFPALHREDRDTDGNRNGGETPNPRR
jgi:hypothetical protein